MAELLIHSLSELREVIEGVLELTEPRHVVEVGSESGSFTERLLAFMAARGGLLTTIDPAPADKVRELGARFPGAHRLLLDRTPQALDGLDAAQVYVIDGDHNYWVVSKELEAIAAATGDEPPVVILHDVGWPCGRRDFYYAPSVLPEGAVHAHTFDRGVHMDARQSVEGGFRGEGVFAVALEEGGPKNGVLTAVEDFMAAHPGHELVTIPAVFGLGILFHRSHPRRDALRALLAVYDRNPILARLEDNRLRNYLQVIALQDLLARVEAARAADHVALAVEREAHEVEREARAAERIEREALATESRARGERIGALERRVEELEERVRALEGQWYHRYGVRVDRAVGTIRRKAGV